MKRITIAATLISFLAVLILEHFLCLFCVSACGSRSKNSEVRPTRIECRSSCPSQRNCEEIRCSPKQETMRPVCMKYALLPYSWTRTCTCKRMPPQLNLVLEERRYLHQQIPSRISETRHSLKTESEGDTERTYSQPQFIHTSIATTILRL